MRLLRRSGLGRVHLALSGNRAVAESRLTKAPPITSLWTRQKRQRSGSQSSDRTCSKPSEALRDVVRLELAASVLATVALDFSTAAPLAHGPRTWDELSLPQNRALVAPSAGSEGRERRLAVARGAGGNLCNCGSRLSDSRATTHEPTLEPPLTARARRARPIKCTMTQAHQGTLPEPRAATPSSGGLWCGKR